MDNDFGKEMAQMIQKPMVKKIDWLIWSVSMQYYWFPDDIDSFSTKNGHYRVSQSKNILLGHSINNDWDDSAVIAIMKLDDGPLFNTKMYQTSKIYLSVSWIIRYSIITFFGTPATYRRFDERTDVWTNGRTQPQIMQKNCCPEDFDSFSIRTDSYRFKIKRKQMRDLKYVAWIDQ